jgi:hypothetical protein
MRVFLERRQQLSHRLSSDWRLHKAGAALFNDPRCGCAEKWLFCQTVTAMDKIMFAVRKSRFPKEAANPIASNSCFAY